MGKSIRFLAAASAVVMALALTACDGKKSAETTAAVTAAAPTTTDTPVTTAVPSTNEAPVTTAVSDTTAKTPETTVPEVTTAPATTTASSAVTTAAPVATEATSATTAPAATTAQTEANVPSSGTTELLSIKDLNTNSSDGSHVKDDYKTASLEINYRETVDLRSDNTGSARYDKAWYPRIKKVNDNLYVMFFMYGQYGQHLYWTTSTDSQNWSSPQVFWNSADHKFTYTDGSLAGTEDRYYAVNADACVLDNGEILCVYSVRPNKGYQEYTEMSGIWMRRGKVDAYGRITWSLEQKIYTGQCWEPFIRQRPDGQVEVYWSSIVGHIEKYGFDEDKRSTCTTMIVSKDNGKTWTPDIQPGAESYVATRIFQQAIGNKVPQGNYTEAVPYFGGQMPSAVQLYNGKTLLAVEVQDLKLDFTISLATSEDGGAWKEIGFNGTGPSTTMASLFDGGAPYLARFPSGEVYLTYTDSSKLYGRMVSPDGTEVDQSAFLAADGVRGSWGSTEIVGSHEVITAAQSKVGEKYGIHLVHSYLNHRINAPKATITADGCTDDWAGNTDALFIGSDTQAQITLRTAHDDANVYFLISRLDTCLTSKDLVSVQIADGAKSYYQVLINMDGSAAITKIGTTSETVATDLKAAVKVFGTVDNTADTDEGAVFEIAVPKAPVGLVGKDSYAVRPMLANMDTGTAKMDTLTGATTNETARWPSVVLE